MIFTIFAIFVFLLANQNVEASSITENVNIIIVIDTETLIEKYPNPSKDPKRPTSIEHNLAYMITSSEFVQAKQGTGDLELKSIAGDNIYWSGVSESNNYETQVILNDIKYSDSNILSPPNKSIRKQMSCIEVADENIAHVVKKKCNYVTLTAEAQNDGKLAYDVHFALYVTPEAGGPKVLYGYFGWDPVIYVGKV